MIPMKIIMHFGLFLTICLMFMSSLHLTMSEIQVSVIDSPQSIVTSKYGPLSEVEIKFSTLLRNSIYSIDFNNFTFGDVVDWSYLRNDIDIRLVLDKRWGCDADGVELRFGMDESPTTTIFSPPQYGFYLTTISSMDTSQLLDQSSQLHTVKCILPMPLSYFAQKAAIEFVDTPKAQLYTTNLTANLQIHVEHLNATFDESNNESTTSLVHSNITTLVNFGPIIAQYDFIVTDWTTASISHANLTFARWTGVFNSPHNGLNVELKDVGSGMNVFDFNTWKNSTFVILGRDMNVKTFFTQQFPYDDVWYAKDITMNNNNNINNNVMHSSFIAQGIDQEDNTQFFFQTKKASQQQKELQNPILSTDITFHQSILQIAENAVMFKHLQQYACSFNVTIIALNDIKGANFHISQYPNCKSPTTKTTSDLDEEESSSSNDFNIEDSFNLEYSTLLFLTNSTHLLSNSTFNNNINNNNNVLPLTIAINDNIVQLRDNLNRDDGMPYLAFQPLIDSITNIELTLNFTFKLSYWDGLTSFTNTSSGADETDDEQQQQQQQQCYVTLNHYLTIIPNTPAEPRISVQPQYCTITSHHNSPTSAVEHLEMQYISNLNENLIHFDPFSFGAFHFNGTVLLDAIFVMSCTWDIAPGAKPALHDVTYDVQLISPWDNSNRSFPLTIYDDADDDKVENQEQGEQGDQMNNNAKKVMFVTQTSINLANQKLWAQHVNIVEGIAINNNPTANNNNANNIWVTHLPDDIVIPCSAALLQISTTQFNLSNIIEYDVLKQFVVSYFQQNVKVYELIYHDVDVDDNSNISNNDADTSNNILPSTTITKQLLMNPFENLSIIDLVYPSHTHPLLLSPQSVDDNGNPISLPPSRYPVEPKLNLFRDSITLTTTTTSIIDDNQSNDEQQNSSLTTQQTYFNSTIYLGLSDFGDYIDFFNTTAYEIVFEPSTTTNEKTIINLIQPAATATTINADFENVDVVNNSFSSSSSSICFATNPTLHVQTTDMNYHPVIFSTGNRAQGETCITSAQCSANDIKSSQLGVFCYQHKCQDFINIVQNSVDGFLVYGIAAGPVHDLFGTSTPATMAFDFAMYSNNNNNCEEHCDDDGEEPSSQTDHDSHDNTATPVVVNISVIIAFVMTIFIL